MDIRHKEDIEKKVCISHEHGSTVVVHSPNISSTYFRLGKIFNTPCVAAIPPRAREIEKCFQGNLSPRRIRQTSFQSKIKCRIRADNYVIVAPLNLWRGGVHLARNFQGMGAAKELRETGHRGWPNLYTRPKLRGPKLN